MNGNICIRWIAEDAAEPETINGEQFNPFPIDVPPILHGPSSDHTSISVTPVAVCFDCRGRARSVGIAKQVHYC